MSNIKLVHSGGNSVSLTVPDSNPSANRTFKLPGADGTSGQAMVTNGSGALSFANAGILVADQWRITGGFTLGGAVSTLASNWERVDTTGRGILGGAMTESSGVFTFPQTGIYLIEFVCGMSTTSAQRYMGHRIQTTTNNSSYAHASDVLNHCGLTNSFGAFVQTTSSVIFDVTDTSQCKVRFAGVAITPGDTSVLGDTNRNGTHATFIRLGDT